MCEKPQTRDVSDAMEICRQLANDHENRPEDLVFAGFEILNNLDLDVVLKFSADGRKMEGHS